LRRAEQLRVTAKNLLLHLGERPLAITERQNGKPGVSPWRELRNGARLGMLKVFFTEEEAPERGVLE
jgi:hypothetical protein